MPLRPLPHKRKRSFEFDELPKCRQRADMSAHESDLRRRPRALYRLVSPSLNSKLLEAHLQTLARGFLKG